MNTSILRRLLVSANQPVGIDGKLWVMPALLEVFGFSSVLKAYDTFDLGKPWHVWLSYAANGAIMITGGVLWVVFRKRIAEIRPWLIGVWRAPKALAAILKENSSLKAQLDISRRENLEEKSETSKAKECYRQCKEEKKVLSIQIAELKANGNQLSLPAPDPQSTLVKPKHNVECVGFVLFTGEDLITATLCFQNVPNGRHLGKFEMPRLRVIYYNQSTGEELADIFPTDWWNESGDMPAVIGNQEQYALIASFFIEHGIWRAVERDESDDSDLSHKISSVELPAGDFHIIASLSGANNVRIMPVQGILALGEDGTASFQRLSN